MNPWYDFEEFAVSRLNAVDGLKKVKAYDGIEDIEQAILNMPAALVSCTEDEPDPDTRVVSLEKTRCIFQLRVLVIGRNMRRDGTSKRSVTAIQTLRNEIYNALAGQRPNTSSVFTSGIQYEGGSPFGAADDGSWVAYEMRFLAAATLDATVTTT
jgi:hypothetical protein